MSRWRPPRILGALCGRMLVLSSCLLPLVSVAGSGGPVVETSHATIASRDGQNLRIVFEAEEQPALLLRPAEAAWDWAQTGRLIIQTGIVGYVERSGARFPPAGVVGEMRPGLRPAG